jgi:peptide maturation system protein (TIGR04066 family)
VVEISHNYEKSLGNCSVVWIVDSWNELDFERFIEPAIRLAIEKGKRVVCSRCLSDTEKANLSNVDYVYVNHSEYTPIISSEDRVQEIRTPVAWVMSTTEYCNQFFIETALCGELRNRGYNPLLISSCKEGVALGEHSVPALAFQGEYSENEKVIAINHYVRQLEMRHKPDIIIMGIPGAVMPYDYKYSADFGILAYEFSEAVRPDFTILSAPCVAYTDNYFKGIEERLQNRLGVSVDVHSLSLYTLDFNEATPKKRLAYLTVDDSYTQEMIRQIGYNNLLNLNNMDGISSAADRLINKLSGGIGSLIM